MRAKETKEVEKDLVSRHSLPCSGINGTRAIKTIFHLFSMISLFSLGPWYVGMNTIHKIYIGELRGFDSETNDLFL